MEQKAEDTRVGKLTDFGKGIVIGFCCGILIVGVIAGLISRHKKDREQFNYAKEYVEKQKAIDTLREDYSSRDALEFIDELPGVRGAADGAAADFTRKRDEAVQRFRNGLSGAAGFID